MFSKSNNGLVMSIFLMIGFLMIGLSVSCYSDKHQNSAQNAQIQQKENTYEDIFLYLNKKEIKLPYHNAVLLFGNPKQKEEFILSKGGISEFRIELYNFFPPDKIQTIYKDVQICEATWQKGNDNFTIWYQKKIGKDGNFQWLYIDSFKWNKEMVF